MTFATKILIQDRPFPVNLNGVITMKRMTTTLLVLMCAASICSTAAAQFQLLGERTIQVKETLWLELTDEPGHLMSEGHRQLRSGNTAASAHNIHKAAVFLQIYANNAKGYIQDDLGDSARDLETVSKGVADGSINGLPILERAFSRAEHALAEFQYGYAKESWTQKEARLAGYRMRAAGNALERSARWSGEELDAGATNPDIAYGGMQSALRERPGLGINWSYDTSTTLNSGLAQ